MLVLCIIKNTHNILQIKALITHIKKQTFSLWGFGALCACLIVISSTTVSYMQYQQQETKAFQESYVLSTLLAEKIKHMMMGVETRFANLALFIENTDPHQRATLIQSIFNKQQQSEASIMDLLLVDPNGVIQQWSGHGTPPNVKDRDYVQAHIKQLPHQGLFIGKPQLSRVHHNQWFFGVSQGIYTEQNQLSYILVAIIDIEFIHTALNASELTTEGSLAVARQDGYIYSRVPDHQDTVGKKLQVVSQIAKAQLRNDKLISPIDNKVRYVGARQIPDTELIVFATLSEVQALASWRNYTIWVFILSMLLIFVVLSFIASFARQQRLLTVSYQKQKDYAQKDNLTGLHNRRYLQEVAPLEIKYAKLKDSPLTLALIDLDHFKKVNDTYGHLVGDQVLKDFAQLVKSMFRQSDILVRFGGEEFLLLLPNTDAQNACLLTEKLRKKVAQTQTMYGKDNIQYTISIGLSQWQKQEANLEEAIKSADDALYQAKLNGRNRIKISSAMERELNTNKATSTPSPE